MKKEITFSNNFTAKCEWIPRRAGWTGTRRNMIIYGTSGSSTTCSWTWIDAFSALTCTGWWTFTIGTTFQTTSRVWVPKVTRYTRAWAWVAYSIAATWRWIARIRCRSWSNCKIKERKLLLPNKYIRTLRFLRNSVNFRNVEQYQLNK